VGKDKSVGGLRMKGGGKKRNSDLDEYKLMGKKIRKGESHIMKKSFKREREGLNTSLT